MARKNLTTVTMNLEKETQGAVRFHEVDADGNFITNFKDGRIGTLYLRKEVFETDTYPKSITVTVKS